MNNSTCNLSYFGYDLVVALTSGGMNTLINTYLDDLNQKTPPENPPTEFFVLGDGKGNGQPPITLAELLLKTNNIDPFEIANSTPSSDSRIQTLISIDFMYGIKVQVGHPPGIAPIALDPPILGLTDGSSDVVLTVYFSQFSVIQLASATNDWSNISQPVQKPWYIQATLSLTDTPVDDQLDTTYFNMNPDKRTAIQQQLKNLPSNETYSLVQIGMQTNGVASNVVTVGGMDAFPAQKAIVQEYVTYIFLIAAAVLGPIPFVIMAKNSSTSTSTLIPTSYEMGVNPLLDDNGKVIPYSSMTSDEEEAIALNVVCAVDNDTLPALYPFPWNWLTPDQALQRNGVIAVNRNTFLKVIQPDLTAIAASFCFDPIIEWYMEASDNSGMEITASFPQDLNDAAVWTYSTTPNGAEVATWNYVGVTSSPSTVSELSSMYAYSNGSISFNGSTISSSQHISFSVSAWVYRAPVQAAATLLTANIDVAYPLTVTEDGKLTVSTPTVSINPTLGDVSPLDIYCSHAGMLNLQNQMLQTVKNAVPATLTYLESTSAQNFVFPAGNVFAFADASFSNYQDLLCQITFVSPTDVEPLKLAERSHGLNDTYVGADDIAKSAPNDTRADAGRQVGAADPNLTMTYSTEMVHNWMQGQIISPNDHFEVIQTPDGLALVFYVDTSGRLVAIEEQNGNTANGWPSFDLSTATITANYNTTASVRTFGVGQSVLDGTIGIAMAISWEGSDYLWVSLGNSNSDMTWLQSPVWTYHAYDDTSNPMPTLYVDGILFTEMFQLSPQYPKQQFIIVDIDRSPESPSRDISRYYIDYLSSKGPYWVEHDVAVDIEDGNYDSCAGRALNEYVDGIYTGGVAGGSGQLAYQPLINTEGSGPPLVRKLYLDEARTVPTAIAAARVSDTTSAMYGCTDLYAIGDTNLYLFTADAQDNETVALNLFSYDVFQGTNDLFAMTYIDQNTNEPITTVWGKNGSGQVYYVSCPADQVTDAASWSVPLPIITNVIHVRPYLNVSDGGNTIFAINGTGVQRIMQENVTLDKMWKTQEILIAPNPEIPNPLLSFNSYTTTLQVVNPDNTPASKVGVDISATCRSPVYINGLYYVLGPNATTIQTSSSGSIAIVEPIDAINGTTITVSLNGVTTTINPMDNSFGSLSSLNGVPALQQAQYYQEDSAGGYFDSTPKSNLIDPSTSSDDLQGVANGMSDFKTAYGDLGGGSKGAVSSDRKVKARFVAARKAALQSELGNWFTHAVGDVFRAAKAAFDEVKHVAEVVVTFVKDTGTGLWNLAISVAGQTWSGIVHTVEAVVSGVVWLFNQVKTGIEKVIQYLKALFAWDDIKRTKEVLTNMTTLYLANTVTTIANVQTAFNGAIGDAETAVAKLTGIDWSPLGTPASKPASGSSSNPNAGQTSSSQMLSNHYQNNASQLTTIGNDPSMSVGEDLIQALLTALDQEEVVLEGAYLKLKQLAGQFSSMNISDVLTQILGILAEGVLSSAQVVVNAVFNILIAVGEAVTELVTVKIHIPIISDLLNSIGIPDVSFLDLFMWIIAVSYTVVYKAVHGAPPFIDDATTTALTKVESWANFLTTANPAKSQIFIAGHAAVGGLGIINTLVSAKEANEEDGGSWGKPAIVLGIATAVIGLCTDEIAPQVPYVDTAASDVSTAVSALTVISKIVFSGPLQSRFATSTKVWKNLAVGDGRATGAIVNSIFTLPQLACSCVHLHELTSDASSGPRSAAIFGEVTNICSYIGRVAYAVIVNNPDDPAIQGPATIVMLAVDTAGSGLQIAESVMLS